MAADWNVPLAGNAFLTTPEAGHGRFPRNGVIAWDDPKSVCSVFVHVDRPAELDVSLSAKVPIGESKMVLKCGDQTFELTLSGQDKQVHRVGQLAVETAGYVRFDVRGVSREGAVFAEIDELGLSSQTAGLTLDYVQSNEGGMFYWGRRGPSVHLSYVVPEDRKLRFAYSEITVPEGQDVIGSYFMANGFGEGYFGMQVNSPTLRKVLFSVWSPFKTDNPRDIPEEQRVKLLAKGPDVTVGEFGNEGSGGQSFLVFPWKAGETYRFLTEVKPDQSGNTTYTSWFGVAAGESWRLIASFQRPKTETDLRGFHSFLENFYPETGHIERSAEWGNVWVQDVDGEWLECTSARFSVDNTGRRRQRLDFTGGAHGDAFFLRNCGFFDETGRAGEVFTRERSQSGPPKIGFESLPRE